MQLDVMFIHQIYLANHRWLTKIIPTRDGLSRSGCSLLSTIRNAVLHNQQMPKFMLQKSRWFTRRWTLQELLAPCIVEIFSKERVKLGDKLSPTKELHEITDISTSALQGKPLSDLDVHERISWSEYRTTKIPADQAYSPMGILGISLSPLDGKRPAEAMKRIIYEVDKQNKRAQDLHPSNPHDDKKRTEETKGGLLVDANRRVLDKNTFEQWQQDPESRLLWVKCDYGKGKTVLLCSITDKLQKSTPRPTILSYLFCQITDPRINSATAVLRGLLYMLVQQQPSLLSYVRRKYNNAGKSLFEGANAWVALAQILADVLRDASLSMTYLIIDMIDECMADQKTLLSLFTKQSPASSCVKRIISSRNWPVIEEQLETAEHKTRPILGLNTESVAASVEIFIREKVFQLAQEKRYTSEN